MLQNVTLLAIVAIHTAANELPKVRQVMNKIHRNVGYSYATTVLPSVIIAPAYFRGEVPLLGLREH